MSIEPTLSDLEDQEPSSQEELEKEMKLIHSDIGGVRLMLRSFRAEEKSLMDRRNWLRLKLDMLRYKPELPAAELYTQFDGTSEPICPDCNANDD